VNGVIYVVIKEASLIKYNSAGHVAEVQVLSSHHAHLSGVKVGYNIPSSEMIPGRSLLVCFIDEWNAKSAVVVAVY
jgi:hypothetical protein